MKPYIKRAIDAAMLILFIYLMNYHVFGALAAHAYAGIALFVLLILHNALNAKYWVSMFRGKYNTRRLVNAVVNTALLIDCVLMAVSAAMMSRAVFYSSPFPMSRTGHLLHKLSASWGYFLVMVHLSIHISAMLKRLERGIAGGKKVIYIALCVIVAAAGLVVLYESGMLRMMMGMRGRIRFTNVWQVIAGNITMIAGMSAAVSCVL